MADVTISGLPQGNPLGNNVIPYSNTVTTLKTPISAIFLNTTKVGIGLGTDATPYGSNLVIRGTTSPTFLGSQPTGLCLLNGSNYDIAGIDFKNNPGSLGGRIAVDIQSPGGTMKFGTSNNYATGITNTALTIDPSGNVDITGPSLRTKGYNHIECASLGITEATRTRVVANGQGWLELGLVNTDNSHFISNNNIFEIISTAPNYGIKIKKAGYLKIDLIQDVISSDSSYIQMAIYQNGVRKSIHLIRNTNGNWDSITGTHILKINENDVISFLLDHVTIVAIDTGLWSYYNFMFWS